MPGTLAATLALAAALTLPQPVQAQGSDATAAEPRVLSASKDVPRDKSGTFTATFENDLFGQGTDEHYTNGFRFSYLTGDNDVPDWLRSTAQYIPLFDGTGNLRASIALGQSMFTPDDLSRKDLIVSERPYAGWLYTAFGLISDKGSQYDTFEVNLGIVGPGAGGEEVQMFVHDLLDAQRPEGWDNQLRNEAGFQFIWSRNWRALYEFDVGGFGVEASPFVTGSLGNVMTYASTGITLRLGEDLRSDYGPPVINPNPPGSGFFAPSSDWSWYVFVSAEGRVVGHNIFLDGNTWTDSHSVDKHELVGTLEGGLVVTIGGTRLSFVQILRSPEFKGQKGPDVYGSASVSLLF
ncbi:lipid A deacylase LpxR family protein [Zavarzinia sp. CC-PAN008]|uniref:lipid A deacylase LpxR family protein n=1 Tax=Zavarzinia sp. CC-PAN008 TaxID=3243332 RepID=UPI003F74A987